MRFEYYRMQEYSLVPVLFFSAVKMYIIYQKIKKTENVLTCLVYYIFLQPPDDAHVSCVWPPAAPYVTLVIGANWGSQLCNHRVTRSRCFTAKKIHRCTGLPIKTVCSTHTAIRSCSSESVNFRLFSSSTLSYDVTEHHNLDSRLNYFAIKSFDFMAK